MSEDTNRIERECIGCKAFLGARFDEKEETRRDEDNEQLQPVEGGFKSEQTGKSPGFGLRAREKVRCGWDHNTVKHLRPNTCTASVPSREIPLQEQVSTILILWAKESVFIANPRIAILLHLHHSFASNSNSLSQTGSIPILSGNDVRP